MAVAIIGVFTACSTATAVVDTVAPAEPEVTTAVVTSTASPGDPEPASTQVGDQPEAPIPSPLHSTRIPGEESPLIPTSSVSCSSESCITAEHYFLERPIDLSMNDQVDVTYRFGTTQGGVREPHHGVEFLNGFGTPVLAAEDGVVVVAGEDIDPTSPRGEWPMKFYGPYSYFYGNLVVIEHEIPEELLMVYPDYPQPVYTLYGHLSEISVAEGEQIQVGQEVGRIGLAGVAMGSHLHFEVRVGENTYESVRNPELWLAPHVGEDGQLNGGIAGRIIDPWGDAPEGTGVVILHLPDGPGSPRDFEIYLQTYQEKGLLAQTPWRESFAIGDLPAGWYLVSFPLSGMQEYFVEVFPGKLTFLTMRVE
jgi:hypothetical protein